MQLCVIADIHGRTHYLPLLRKIRYDVLVICGDITSFGHCKEALAILEMIQEPFLAVHGNCDFEDTLEALNMRKGNLHGRTVVRENQPFSGFGGSNPFVGGTPSEYPEDIIYEGLSHVPRECILVTHAPPHHTATDRALKIKHAGSKAVRQVIEEKEPKIALCGHIHESRNIDYIGQTLVVNPGKFCDGYYALVSVEDRDCRLERFGEF